MEKFCFLAARRKFKSLRVIFQYAEGGEGEKGFMNLNDNIEFFFKNNLLQEQVRASGWKGGGSS